MGNINEVPKAFHYVAWLVLKDCATTCIEDHRISVEDVDAAMAKNDPKNSPLSAPYLALWFLLHLGLFIGFSMVGSLLLRSSYDGFRRLNHVL